MDIQTALSNLPPPNPVLEPAYWDDPDSSEGTRRPSASSRGSARASLAVSAGNRFRMMHVESSLEYKWAVVFDGLLKPLHLVEQPDVVEYIDFDGFRRTHRFDFYLQTVSRRRLVEIKPAVKVRKYNLEPKFNHIAAQVSADRADEVILLTDEDLWVVSVNEVEIRGGVGAAIGQAA